MVTRSGPNASRTKKTLVFIVVLLGGFAMFAGPAIFFQMGGAGGYEGANLAVLGLVQLVLVSGVVFVGLRALDSRFRDIGLSGDSWRSDAILGLAAGAGWALLQFGLLFPVTGGATRPDIAAILDMVDDRWANVLWYLPLGILGGGIAEEIYNRGFTITILEDVLGGGRLATLAAATFAVFFFAAGHLPQGWVSWVDILVPSTVYVVLFLHTRRLTAPMVAHAVWNATAVVGIYLVYG